MAEWSPEMQKYLVELAKNPDRQQGCDFCARGVGSRLTCVLLADECSPLTFGNCSGRIERCNPMPTDPQRYEALRVKRIA